LDNYQVRDNVIMTVERDDNSRGVKITLAEKIRIDGSKEG